MANHSISLHDVALRRHQNASLVSRFLRTLDGFVVEAYQTGFIQSTIVHTSMLLLLALCVTATEPHRPKVRLAMDFTSPAEPPLELTDEILAEPLDEPMDIAAESMPLEPAPDVSLAAGMADSEIEPVSFEQAETPSVGSAHDLLAEIPAVLSSDVQPQARFRPTSRGQGSQGSGSGLSGTGNSQGSEIDGELGRRLAAAGAQTGDVQISIAWEGINDIDVHVQVEPLQGGMASIISWRNRQGLCGGMLDVDANASSFMLTQKPVENIFWAKGQAPNGRFPVAVHHFRSWTGQFSTPIEVAVLVDGELKRFYPVATYGQNLTTVYSFERRPQGQAPALMGDSAGVR
jgi:hypothetical protein